MGTFKKVEGLSPSVNITLNKGRIKTYTGEGMLPTCYLKNGQEFEFELFNPTKDVIMAKIHINGNTMSNMGLVLRPGERIFLERYLDDAKKFKFDTYEVEDTDEVKEATKNNGSIVIQFIRELKNVPQFNTTNLPIQTSPFNSNQPYQPYWGSMTNTSSGSYMTNINGTITNSQNINNDLRGGQKLSRTRSKSPSETILGDKTSTTASNLENLGNTTTFSSTSTGSLDWMTQELSRGIVSTPTSKVETGRVEKGNVSQQKVTVSNYKFERSSFMVIEMEIKPISTQIIESSDLKVKMYCTNCGAKIGPKDKFCSQCGNKN